MKICAIGDAHGDLEKIKKIPLKDVDLILLTGDLGKADLARKRFFENIEREKKGLPALKEDAEHVVAVHNEIHPSTIDLLRYLSKYSPVYSLMGNVGIPNITEVKKYYKKYGLKLPCTREEINTIDNVHLIKNRLRVINGIRVGFLENFLDVCWTKEFEERDKKRIRRAKKETEKAKRILKRFGSELDILVCHQPPYGVLDKVDFPGAPKLFQGKHAGNKVILDYIEKYQPRYVFCGHIHEGEGKAKIGKTEVYNLGVAGYKIVEL